MAVPPTIRSGSASVSKAWRIITLHGGSIEVIDATNANDLRLALRPDTNANFTQWFCWRITGAKGKRCRFVIENAGDATFPDAFEGYRACRSEKLDDETGWLRVPTAYQEGVLTITDTPSSDEVFYAYFAPYPDTRLERLIERAAASPEVTTRSAPRSARTGSTSASNVR